MQNRPLLRGPLLRPGRAPKQQILTILVSIRTVKEMSRLPGFDNLPVDLFEDVPEW